MHSCHRPYLLILLLLLIGGSLASQEICDNGIDDDADGLVDLNDTTDCNCGLAALPPSLIPNPSFENFTEDFFCESDLPGGQPDRPDNLSCIPDWRGATNRPSEVWHLLTLNGAPFRYPAALPEPIPDGLAVAGFSNSFWFPSAGPSLESVPYRQFLSACLDGGPLLVGEDYRLQFDLGFGQPHGNPIGPVYSYSHSPISVSLYGSTQCNPPVSTESQCLSQSQDWELIVTTTVAGSPGTWSDVTLNFLAESPYQSVAIGPSCSPLPGNYNGFAHRNEYVFVDRLILNTPTVLDEHDGFRGIQVSGADICDTDARMWVQDFPDATYQWYRNGIVIAGATENNYYPAWNGPAYEGDYQCRIQRPGGCGILGPVPLRKFVVQDAFQDSVHFCDLSETRIQSKVPHAQYVDYLWEDGSTRNFLTVPAPGTYAVTVTSFCESHVEEIVVTDLVEPSYSLGLDPTRFCPGDTVGAFIQTNWQIFGSLRPMNSSFFDPIGVGDTSRFVVGQVNAFEIEVLGDGCIDGYTVEWPVEPEPISYALRYADLNCGLPAAEIYLEYLPGLASDYEFTWFGPDGTVVSTDSAFTATQPGDYRMVLRPLELSCTIEEDFTLESSIDEELVLPFDPPVLNCLQGSVDLAVTFVYPEQTGAEWSLDGEIIATDTATYVATTAGDYVLYVYLEDEAGNRRCERTYEYSVISQEISFTPEVSSTLTDNCDGRYLVSWTDPVDTSNWTVSWFEEGAVLPFASGPAPMVSFAPGIYRIVVEHLTESCLGEVTFTLDTLPAPILTSEVAELDCPTGQDFRAPGNIFATGELGQPPYLFNLTGPFSTSNLDGFFGDLPPGSYQLWLEDDNGCPSDTTRLTIEAYEPPVIEAGNDRLITLGESISLRLDTAGTGPGTVSWSPEVGLSCVDCFTPIATPASSTTYFASFTQQNGCVLTDSLRINIEAGTPGFVPSAFSPNGDGTNDTFRFFPTAAVADVLAFSVFDRWGNQRFRGEGLRTEWDGRSPDGRLADPGVYLYRIDLELLNGNRLQLHGDVSLLR